MNTQLYAIGFRPDDGQQLFTLLSLAAEKSRLVMGKLKGMEHRLWVDPSGAGLAVHMKHGKVEAMTPWFESDTVWPAQVTALLTDQVTVHWSGIEATVPAPGGARSGVAIHIKDISAWRQVLVPGFKCPLQMAVIGEDVQIFPTEEEFRAAQREFWGKNERGESFDPPPSFILPTGKLLTEKTPEGKADKDRGDSTGLVETATALLAGRITHTEHRENGLTRKSFRVLRAEIEGLDTEIAYWKTRDGREPEPGQIALVHAWLAGTPVNSPPPPPEKVTGGLLARWFG